MPLLKYTTEVPVSKTVAEIFGALRAAGADKVLIEYEDQQERGISFEMKTLFGPVVFRVPVDVPHTAQVLKNQYHKGIAPRAVLRDGQAARVSWRIVKDWLDAQLALIQIEVVSLDQIFLPYAVTPSGQTFYDIVVERGGLPKLLGAGQAQAEPPRA